MNQKTLLKLALTISLLGIIALLIISNILELPLSNISEITNNKLDKKIKIRGEIFNIKSYDKNNFQIISIKDSTGKVDITTDKILPLKNNQKIEVQGKITDYKQYLQIQAEKILLIK